MISTLQRTFKPKKEISEPASKQKMNEYEVIARLYYLIKNLSDEQQLDLFKQFLNGNTANFLLKMAIDMSKEQRFIFMKHLEEMTLEKQRPERREYTRKHCLINVDFKIRGQRFNSYILDLSPYGGFIETSGPFSSGLKMQLMFSSPENRESISLIGEIIWADTRGVGVRFHHLSRHQLGILKAFSDKTGEVLEINS